MKNGNITIFRIVASAIIGLTAVGGGIFLLYVGVTIPREFWFVTIAALSGVVGVDLLASLVKTVKK